MPEFAHLHLHTEYSLLDGACPIGKLLDRVKAAGMTACAITDHGVMYGVVDFYTEAKKRGIHPVIGCEVYVCEDMDEKQSAAREYNHLVLLCENEEGYRNLTQLVSFGYTRGFYYKPRIDHTLLRKHASGLIALSACLSGEIPQALLDGREQTARQAVQRYVDIFGKDNFFMEIQDHGIPDERRVLPQLVRLAREMDVPLVATNDVHYLEREDALAQEVLMCIQTGKTLEDENRMRMTTQELYLKTPDEMAALFSSWPEAVSITQTIAERCRVEFDFNTIHLPEYPLPKGMTGSELMRSECARGMEALYPPDNAAARERLEYELSVIEQMGYVDYFLIVWDFVKYARDHGIMVGPGRGSGAGSIVAYVLGITGVDPLKYNLLFERFLNPERISMPDFDIDFCYERRQEVIDYVAQKYGEDHVAQIITFGTMAAKAVIRDVGRVLGYPYAEVDSVAKLVPFSLDMTLEKALQINPDFKKRYTEDDRTHRLVDMAMKLEGMPRHASTHAAGVLITQQPVTQYVPLQKNDDIITTQFPMGTLERLGLLKMDFLGLRTLTVIHDTLEMMREAGIDMQPEDIPLDDPKVYEMISDGDTDGVFQLESGGMRSFVTNMRPETFEDIIAAISLYRPGPMDSIPRYIECKRDPQKVRYLHEKLRPILDVTYGCMVYQEQVMQIVRDVAGYSMGRSDLVRRAMSKKKHDVMAQERTYFIHGLVENGQVTVPGAVRNGVPEDVAARIFDEMAAFASYAFGKSHATGYSVLSVQTAWLKVHHPVQFMAALMNSVMSNTGKIAQYIQYCRKHGIAVLRPDINKSRAKFSVDTDPDTGKPGIRFGLGAVKGAGAIAVDAIVQERTQAGPFRDIYDLARRAADDRINKRVVESLIKAGALDSTGANRAQLLQVFEAAMEGAAQVRRRNVAGQLSLFEGLGAESSVPDVSPVLPPAADFDPRQRLAMEKEVTGVYITGHPLDEYRAVLDALEMNTALLADAADREDHGMMYDGLRTQMGGILADTRSKATKSGTLMGFVVLEDLTGQIEGLVFPRVWERIHHALRVDMPTLLTGRLSVREDEPTKLIVEDARALETTVEAAGIVGMHDMADAHVQSGPIYPYDGAGPYHWADANGMSNAQDASGMADVPARNDIHNAPASKLYIRIATRPQMDAALPLLSARRGSSPVLFRIDDEAVTLKAPECYWCVPDRELLQTLSGCYGADNVKLVQLQ